MRYFRITQDIFIVKEFANTDGEYFLQETVRLLVPTLDGEIYDPRIQNILSLNWA